MVGLMDCNNFFVSCERVFAPELRGRPVVVLSNNDGCVVSRSNEAKALGIPMGEPFFRLRKQVESGEVFARSGNIRLYGDMSRRVMSVARRFVPRTEEYSIDECFLDLDGVADPQSVGRELAATVLRWTGIPVSVGVAPNKTLAKLASHFAKRYAGYEGCCLIDSEERRVKALKLTPVGEVWGIGRQLQARLKTCGVKTAYDFASWRQSHVQKFFSQPGVWTWCELNGQRKHEVEAPQARKSLMRSHSFKSPITDYEHLRSLVADFASTCAAQLRREHSAAQTIGVHIRTDSHRPDLPQYANALSVRLDVATSDLREIVSAATLCLERIYRNGFGYKKAGVMLSDLQHRAVQSYLFDTVDRPQQERLLKAVDEIRQRLGNDAIRVASQESCLSDTRREYQSPCYTTDLRDIITVK